MSMKMFVNLPVKDLDRSKEFFTALGFAFFGMAENMASVIINEDTQVMLLTESLFATYTDKEVADATRTSEVILVVGVENPAAVDALIEKAAAAGATAGDPRETGYSYQRSFIDRDGHHWEALCLVDANPEEAAGA